MLAQYSRPDWADLMKDQGKWWLQTSTGKALWKMFCVIVMPKRRAQQLLLLTPEIMNSWLHAKRQPRLCDSGTKGICPNKSRRSIITTDTQQIQQRNEREKYEVEIIDHAHLVLRLLFWLTHTWSGWLLHIAVPVASLVGRGGEPGSHGNPQHTPFHFFENMTTSLWWLSVGMGCVFVLDLMPSCFSKNDCEAVRRMKEWTLVSGSRLRLSSPALTDAVSQQESHQAAVWFGDFVNAATETCQSPWFTATCCCLWSPRAYRR